MDEHCQHLQSQRRSADTTASAMPVRPGPGTVGAGTSRDSRGGDAPSATEQFFAHSTARRINTDSVMASALKRQYPSLKLSIVPQFSADLLSFAGSGLARATPLEDEAPGTLSWKFYVPPARRLDGFPGGVAKSVVFGKFVYRWSEHDFIVYLVDGRDGTSAYPQVLNYYILSAGEAVAEALIMAAGKWANELREEIWVFDSGMWTKDAELYRSVRKASWDAVILDPEMKKALIDDHLSFFRSRETYAQLKVPWKRGIIYYGPPGNGKTISIKAMMNSLYGLESPVPTLYVRTLSSFAGPEYSIQVIFRRARQFAPCYLVFEDLDSIVSDGVRSYFLNEVDGLQSNDGIFMIGSTNHLDRLDPGIAKRPSRFDRKYLFPNPDFGERVAYCRFWQSKLADNKDVAFPDKLCSAIAGITDKFSFAYMQEAFVAALLAIARKGRPDALARDMQVLTVDAAGDWVEVLGRSAAREDPDLDRLVLWAEIQKQIKFLREGMDEENRGE
ncbi:putative ATPase YjoB [Tolypocladium ophioglossoides CBS 100239]|uniref:Putative ATPase YjoB n=1 Tax=Tolypocladium ophioglossoides (strain CBS 100239) TaxID=1163406 RepID=A0A0L0N702_TOLOC|nr:putative ATPase YjoB [Tolypocladium ophioglossoides CBS 100239]